MLIVDDEANIRRMLGRLLQGESYHTMEADGGRQALEQADAEDPDVVLLDLAMPGMSGMDVLRALRERRPELPVVMISGRATLQDAVEATKLGAFHFIEKPLTPEAVLMTVKGAVELRRARDLTTAALQQRGSLQELVGDSDLMVRTRELIQQAAPTEARVLLTGESGTGKELAAEALHSLSRRAEGPFVRVNSAAIPRELIESEMFGHEKGAFTGATSRHRGRFELADGGTLFLDEVAELGPEAQAKLLRALEAHEIERVGGKRPIPVNVRVIAATNRDLEQEMEAGRFRQDVYYRLNVVPIHLPALKDRVDDIPALVDHLSSRLRARQGLDPPTMKDDALELLRRYDWPGNVRELANVCERLAILYPGGMVGAGEIGPMIPRGEPTRSLTDHLDAEERRLILDALETARGNVAEAARSLRTDRPNLYRRMRRLGIDR
ncbi:MAG: sigma-54 dependent transcriptional regulator [Gemmatimonadota bacterium]